MRIWLDDKRPMPDGFDEHVLTAQDAINRIETGEVTKISLDHDLGDETEVGNGYMVAKHIEERAYHGCIKRIDWSIHSQNSVGVQNMKVALENANSFWSRNEDNGTVSFDGTSEPFGKSKISIVFYRNGARTSFEEYLSCFSDEDQKILKNPTYVFVVVKPTGDIFRTQTDFYIKKIKYTKEDLKRIKKETKELIEFFGKESKNE
jgi:hypothetical protein